MALAGEAEGGKVTPLCRLSLRDRHSGLSGLFSTRMRLYHQSTHLGDEFVLHNPGFNRVNYSYEEGEAILSLDAPGGWGRLYTGGGYLLHREPANLDRLKVQAGVKLRGPTWGSGPIERFVSGPRTVLWAEDRKRWARYVSAF